MRKIIVRLLIASFTFIISVVGVSNYLDYQSQREHLLWQESRLRIELYDLRHALDYYAADKGVLPQSLDDLVRAEYLEEVPADPVTHRKVWKIVIGDAPNSLQSKRGIVDVHSTSTALSSQGTTYEQW